MKPVKAISVFLLGVVFSFLTFEFFGAFYRQIYGVNVTSGFDTLLGFPAAYLLIIFFLIPLVFTNLNKWLFVILSIPAIAFEIMFDPLHIYFPFFFGFIGLGLGLLVRRLYTRHLAK